MYVSASIRTTRPRVAPMAMPMIAPTEDVSVEDDDEDEEAPHTGVNAEPPVCSEPETANSIWLPFAP